VSKAIASASERKRWIRRRPSCFHRTTEPVAVRA
jgi:hypothetical protein